MPSFLLIDKKLHYKHRMISLVKNLMYFTANIHYYHNRWHKSLKAVIASKCLISAGLDIDRILYFVFL